MRDRPNDISLVAVAIADTIYFRLHLSLGDRGSSPSDVDVLIKPEESLQVLTAMTEVYCNYTRLKLSAGKQQKPRLRELLHDWGLETYLQAVAQCLSPLPQQNQNESLQRECIDHS